MIQRGPLGWLRQTTAEIKSALGLGSAAYTATEDYAAAGHNHAGVYDPAGTATAAVSGHAGATDPHGDRAYADSLVVGLVDDRGNFDGSINTFPTTGGSGTAGAILKGDLWTLSVVAASGPLAGYSVGCLLRALSDTPGQTAGNWAITAVGFGYSPENSANKSADVTTDAASTSKYPTVKSLYDWATGLFAPMSHPHTVSQITDFVTPYLGALVNIVQANQTQTGLGNSWQLVPASIFTNVSGPAYFNANKAYVAPGNGVYQASGLITFASVADNVAIVVGVYKNGELFGLLGRGTVASASVSTAGFGGVIMVPMAAGDTLALAYYMFSPNPVFLTAAGGYIHFSVRRITG